ncbi:MAG: hypothetical protein II821_01720 [Treponema sp.]|nr:hypothetical protein [Treponema sp.]
MAKNKKEFKPETFQIYMEAPCGRKLTHVVLKDLGKSEEYKNLLIYKPSFIQSVKRCFEKPTFKVTYIDKELISKINNGKSAAQKSL